MSEVLHERFADLRFDPDALREKYRSSAPSACVTTATTSTSK